MAGGDVEKTQFVRPCGVISLRRLDRIAGVAQIDEVDALDDAAILDVKTWDEAGLEHQALARLLTPSPRSRASACAGSSRPS